MTYVLRLFIIINIIIIIIIIIIIVIIIYFFFFSVSIILHYYLVPRYWEDFRQFVFAMDFVLNAMTSYLFFLTKLHCSS